MTFRGSAMWRTIGFAFATAAFVVFFPADVTAQKKKQVADPEAAEQATEKEYKMLMGVKEMSGKLVSVSAKSVTFRLDIPHMEPNPNYNPGKGGAGGRGNNNYQQLQNMYRQQNKAKGNGNPLQRQQQMQQLMKQMQQQQQKMMQAAKGKNNNPNNNNNNNNNNNGPFRLAHSYKDYELELAPNVVIRKLFVDAEYDDKGNLKVYSKEELAALQGKDKTKPGFKAKVEDLQGSPPVSISLAMPKKAKPAAEKEEKKAPEKAAEAPKAVDKADQVGKLKIETADFDEPSKPVITMIVILRPPDPQAATPEAPKKKKK